jgi:cytochrome oxidase Cu insertion factor (SCO1/SenC/PrrC family)
MRTKIAVSFLLLTILFALGADPVVGKEKAPNFTLVDINGKQFSLSDHLGKVVLLDFFTTWCGPCIFEIEHLKGLYNEYSPDQFVILSISVDPYTDTIQILHSFAQQNEMTWTVTRDTDNVASKYGVSPIPHLVIVDAEGYKRHNHIGLTAESTFRSEIDSLISEIGNSDPNANPDTGQTEPPYTLIAAIGVGVIVFLVVGIVVARKLLGRSKPAKKRRSRKRKR